MTTINVADRVTISGTTTDAWGRLIAKARISRDGLYDYHSLEVGDRGGDRILKIYRPPSEVFDKAVLAGFARAPVTIDHPAMPMQGDGKDREAEQVGHVDPVGMGREVLASGEFFTANLIIDRAAGVAAIQDGNRELSAGYQSDIDLTPGTTPDGTRYDGVMTKIRADHVALVPRGRAGPDARVGDAAPYAYPSTSDADPAGKGHKTTDGNPKPKEAAMPLMIDGLPVAEDQAQAHIDAFAQKAKDGLTEARDALADAVKARDEAVKAKDEAEAKAVEAEARATVAEKAVEETAANAEAIAEANQADRSFIAKRAPAVAKATEGKPIGDARKAYVDAEFGVDDSRDDKVTDALFKAARKQGDKIADANPANPTPTTNDAKREAYIARRSGKTVKEAA